MGRRPCCEKEGLNRGAWSVGEDKILTNYINMHGEGQWRDLPLRAGLKRCGKSCRLRWLNYLRPGIKRGNFSAEEEQLIVKLHSLLGNRWSLIAGRLPARTDNEIKNYWNTHLSKKAQAHKIQNNCVKDQNHFQEKDKDSSIALKPGTSTHQPHHIIKPKAVRCNQVVIIPRHHPDDQTLQKNQGPTASDHHDSPWSSLLVNDDHHHEDGNSPNFLGDFDISELGALQYNPTADDVSQMILNTWSGGDLLHPLEALELKKLAWFLDSEEEWISE